MVCPVWGLVQQKAITTVGTLLLWEQEMGKGFMEEGSPINPSSETISVALPSEVPYMISHLKMWDLRYRVEKFWLLLEALCL